MNSVAQLDEKLARAVRRVHGPLGGGMARIDQEDAIIRRATERIDQEDAMIRQATERVSAFTMKPEATRTIVPVIVGRGASSRS